MAQIEIKNLTFFYPDMEKGEYLENPALCNINLEIHRGEFMVICGQTGCGKSTLLRTIKPIICPNGKITGNVLYNGINIKDLKERQQAEKIGFVMQNPDNQIVTDKVWHELAFGLENIGLKSEEIRQKTAEIAEYFELTDLYYLKPDKLSGGQKQLLNLAAVMTMNPEILLLDEPTSQLDPIATEKFVSMLKKINEDLGVTIIMSEHRLSYVLDMADKLVVMNNGKIMEWGNPLEIADKIKNQKISKLMPYATRVYYECGKKGTPPVSTKDGRKWLERELQDKEIPTDRSDRKGDLSKGKFIQENHKEADINKKEMAITCKNLWFRYEKYERDIIKGLYFSVRRGEIFAILGGNGTGKSTTMWLLSGVKKPYRGKITKKGKVALLPQSVQNLFSRDKVSKELEGCENSLIEEMEIQDILNRHPYDISGGQQQKVALAKILMENPDILLLDEPTKAIDEVYKEELGNLLRKLSADGKTIIIVSHDLDFCGEYADRCGMFADGKLIAVNNNRDFFTSNNFYTTTVAKMSRSTIKGAVKMEDIVCYLKNV